MSGHSHGHPQSPEDDARIAHEALAQGDLVHAVHHIGCALSARPLHPEWLGMLDSILRRVPDPLSLAEVDEDEETSFVTASTRAWAYSVKGQWVDALHLVAQVVGTRPDVAYLGWVERWLSYPNVLPSIPFDDLMGAFAIRLVRDLPRLESPTDPVGENLRSAERIFAHVRAVHPGRGFSWYASSSIARKLGKFPEAVDLSRQGAMVEPSFMTAIGHANALREAGRIEEAVAQMHEARRHDPEDVTTFLDVGDMRMDQERWQEAADAYAQVLAKEPSHPFAGAYMHYARFKGTGNPAEREALLALRDRRADEPRVVGLAREIQPLEAFVTFMPFPGDATAKGIAQLLEHVKEKGDEMGGGTMNMKVTHPESPSVLLAAKMGTRALQPPMTVAIEVEKIQTPDPRQPKGRVDFVAWVYDAANVPHPNVPPPDPKLAAAVAAIATRPYDLEGFTAHARGLAAQLQPGWIPPLVSTMVHPPPPPDLTWEPFTWIQKIQFACALTIGQIGQGWDGTPRRGALIALALGPVDWVCNAAIFAIVQAAKTDPAARRELDQLFPFLERSIPRGSYTSYEYPLSCAWLLLPDLDPQTRARVTERRTACQEGRGSDQQEEGFDLEAEKQKAAAAQQALQSGQGGDPDPVVFPGSPVARLSDYVFILKEMQRGNMNGALGRYGLDMMSYATVATQWGQRVAADPVLNAKFGQMMTR